MDRGGKKMRAKSDSHQSVEVQENQKEGSKVTCARRLGLDIRIRTGIKAFLLTPRHFQARAFKHLPPAIAADGDSSQDGERRERRGEIVLGEKNSNPVIVFVVHSSVL